MDKPNPFCLHKPDRAAWWCIAAVALFLLFAAALGPVADKLDGPGCWLYGARIAAYGMGCAVCALRANYLWKEDKP